MVRRMPLMKFVVGVLVMASPTTTAFTIVTMKTGGPGTSTSHNQINSALNMQNNERGSSFASGNPATSSSSSTTSANMMPLDVSPMAGQQQQQRRRRRYGDRLRTALAGTTSALAGSLKKAVKWGTAKKSAEIYMNPATATIANVTISWEPDAAKQILAKQQKVQTQDKPFMVGVVGIPGSGKSTSSDILASMLDKSIVMPMDGYHLPMSTLNELPNAVEMIYRRGAPDTFDPTTLNADLEKIVNGNDSKVSIPGFDHALGDPTPNQHTFDRSQHDIVICEGIYLMHDDDGWENIKSYFDWIIYIEADIDTCIGRLKERNKCIPGYTEEEIEIRCDAVDRVNAETVERSRHYAMQEVKSGAAKAAIGVSDDGECATV